MDLLAYSLIDNCFFRAVLAIPGRPDHLVVKVELIRPDLPLFLEYARWERTGEPAMDVVASHAAEILSLVTPRAEKLARAAHPDSAW